MLVATHPFCYEAQLSVTC